MRIDTIKNWDVMIWWDDKVSIIGDFVAAEKRRRTSPVVAPEGSVAVTESGSRYTILTETEAQKEALTWLRDRVSQ